MEVMDKSSICRVTQFVGDNIDLNIVSIYGTTPFHSMGLIEVISPAPPSAQDPATASFSKMKMQATDKARILKAADVKILPFTNRKQTGINSITFLLIAELSSTVTEQQLFLFPCDTFWAAGWVIES